MYIGDDIHECQESSCDHGKRLGLANPEASRRALEAVWHCCGSDGRLGAPHACESTFVESAPEKGVAAFIVGAGAAAHLAGVVASYTTLPVIGVPINATSLNGMDALLSTVQMPSGIPVATMAINGAKNAAIFAVEMFSIADDDLKKQLADYREEMVAGVEKKAARVAAQL